MNKVFIVYEGFETVDGIGFNIIKVTKTLKDAQNALIKRILEVQEDYPEECVGSCQVDYNCDKDFDYWCHINDNFYYCLQIEERNVD